MAALPSLRLPTGCSGLYVAAIMEIVRDLVTRARDRVSAPELAMLLMLVSTLGFAGMHAIIRYASRDMHPFEIAFFRNFFGLLVLAPFIYRAGLGALRTNKLHLHAIRLVLYGHCRNTRLRHRAPFRLLVIECRLR